MVKNLKYHLHANAIAIWDSSNTEILRNGYMKSWKSNIITQNLGYGYAAQQEAE